MSKITKQLAICAALRRRGFKPRPDKDTRKFVVFESATGRLYWVGKMGALRIGPSVSKTMSLGDNKANHLAKEGGYEVKQPLNPRCDMGGSNTEHLSSSVDKTVEHYDRMDEEEEK
jgi:hypothetical protein